MALENKPKRLSAVARDLNVATSTIIQFLQETGFEVESVNPNTKLPAEYVELLSEHFKESITLKEKAIKNSEKAKELKEQNLSLERKAKEEELLKSNESEEVNEEQPPVEVELEKPIEENVDEIIVSTKVEPEIIEPDVVVAVENTDLEENKEKIEEQEEIIVSEQKDIPETSEDLDLNVDIETSPEPEIIEEPQVPMPEAPPVEEEVQMEEPVSQSDLEPKEEEAPVSEKEEEIIETPEEKPIITPVEKTDEEDSKGAGPVVLGRIDLDQINSKTRPKKKTKEEKNLERKQKFESEKAERKQASERINNQQSQTTKPIEEKKVVEQVKEEPVVKISTPEPEKIETQDSQTSKVSEDTDRPISTKPVEDFIATKFEKLTGPNVVGKINIDAYIQSQANSEKKKIQAKEERQKQREQEKVERRAKRKRIEKVKVNVKVNVATTPGSKPPVSDNKKKRVAKPVVKPKKKEINDDEVQKQIKETLARLTTPKQKSKTSKHRRDKRELVQQRQQLEFEKNEAEKNILKVTEFVSVSELSTMIDVPATQLISTFMSLGLFVSINQRLDAETMAIVAEEYGYKIEFVSADVLEEIDEQTDDIENLQDRPPIVTVMGHVDHGKTKLLDRIRHTNVVEGEAGGITQHIGAYSVTLPNGKQITFLDTPGHEAFTAMRARGAKVTDVAIIIIAADDDVMPQTVEAINHASAAGVPIVFAINKVDKPAADPEKIKTSLAAMNYLVEDWGGKYQSQEISAKSGLNIEGLLEKVLLEAEILDLKADPDRNAVGTVIESSLDKGRGYVSTILVQSGTLTNGDILLAGSYTGRIKAMYNERGQKVDKAGPSAPVLVLGLNGAPQAGDKFNVMGTDHEARALANKRLQLQREQGLRTQKHITLDEIGRRLALGNFNEINIIVKGDVDGSVEALSDSLIKLSTESFAVNIIHKAVGQISESDVILATASNAIIVGFQVRPSSYARKLAEKEEIEIRLYSVIYDAINEIKDAMEGMLSPEVKEKITGSCEVREVFKITKVGTIAGCFVTDGKIFKKSKVRIIRDGIVIYTGDLGSLKRFKDEVKEVVSGLECGLNIERFNDIKVADIIEAFDEFEVKQTL